jgi:hypothetical protein
MTHLDASLLQRVGTPPSGRAPFAFAVLRNPLRRTLSAWRYSGSDARMGFAEYVTGYDARAREAYAADAARRDPEVGSRFGGARSQLRQLAGRKECSVEAAGPAVRGGGGAPGKDGDGLRNGPRNAWLEAPAPSLEAEARTLLPRALSTLDRLDFVGLQECLAFAAEHLARALDLPALPEALASKDVGRPARSTPRSPASSDAAVLAGLEEDPATAAALWRIFRPELKVWAAAAERHHRDAVRGPAGAEAVACAERQRQAALRVLRAVEAEDAGRGAPTLDAWAN